MNEELTKLLPDIHNTIKALDLRLYESMSKEALDMLIEIAYTVVKNDGLDKDKIVYGISLIILDMISGEYVTNISSKRIKDVAITMGSGYNASKWKMWYDALLNGDTDGVYALRYVGVG